MKNIGGNYYKKHQSKNPIVNYLMNNFHSTLFDLIEEVNPNSMLDVGCGEGYTVQEIIGRFPHIALEGSDLENDVIELARKNLPDINFKVESASNLQRDDNSFELVSMLEVLEHVEHPDESIREAKRVSSKFCIFSVPFEPYWRVLNVLRLKYLSELGNTPGHINHWSKAGFEKLLKNHFNDVKVQTVFPWNFALCAN